MSVEDEQVEREDHPEPAAADFVKLLDYLKHSRGFDFSGYKLAGLIRRVRKRMQQIEVESYLEYIDFLEVHPDEFDPLFNTVLINVTAFFRDPQAWQALQEQILPRILESKSEDQPVRCWIAGCASGEEAYTLAMLLAEAVGDQQFRQRVKIYATDVDQEALAQARQGSYPAAAVENLPEGLLAKYFEPAGDRFVFRPDLRRSLIFGRHDLVQDAAISRLDLVVCRNTLMYFNSEAQAKILARFHFALRPSGYLLLGKAETLLSHNASFRPEVLKSRIFQRTSTATTMRDRLLALTPTTPAADSLPGGVARPVRVCEAAFDSGPVAQIAFDRKGHLLLANEKARQLCNLAPADLGRLLQDLEISYRPAELRTHIEAVSLTRTGVTVREVEWRPVGGERRVLDILVAPLIESGNALLGVGVSFLDVTIPHQLRRELERSTQDLETASEELQSSNEELETTNEELQSTIEELETMNEELQSTNEELRSMNDQIQQRSTELRHVNVHLHSILGSLRAAVVVLNADLVVELWSDKAQELWGLRGDEVQGQPFLSLDIGLPVEGLAQPIRDCLNSGPNGTGILIEGVNRRGRPIHCQVTCTRLGEGPGPVDGVILLMEEAPVAGDTGAGLED